MFFKEHILVKMFFIFGSMLNYQLIYLSFALFDSFSSVQAEGSLFVQASFLKTKNMSSYLF